MKLLFLTLLLSIFAISIHAENIHNQPVKNISSVLLVKQTGTNQDNVKPDTADKKEKDIYDVWIWVMVLGGGFAFVIIGFITSLLSNRKKRKKWLEERAKHKN